MSGKDPLNSRFFTYTAMTRSLESTVGPILLIKSGVPSLFACTNVVQPGRLGGGALGTMDVGRVGVARDASACASTSAEAEAD
eukprot:7848305-Karenia_brevis.AAC.1